MAQAPRRSATALTKGERTRLAMLQAAVDILDEHGPDGLTLHAVGERVDRHPTAAYRHFDSRDHLLAETLGYLVAGVSDRLTLSEDPYERLMAVCLGVRGMFHRYPGASTIFVTTAGTYTGSAQLTLLVVQALRDLGVAEPDLAETYQMVESYVVGASLFDFAAAPHHLESRRHRHAAVGEPALGDLTSAARVDANNEAAFRRGLNRLLPRGKKSQSD
jgi:AcrR family transcriptional regulator